VKVVGESLHERVAAGDPFKDSVRLNGVPGKSGQIIKISQYAYLCRVCVKLNVCVVRWWGKPL
jgi:hypothetical protein